VCEREGDNGAPPRIAADDTASNCAGRIDADDADDAEGSGGIEAESRPMASWRCAAASSAISARHCRVRFDDAAEAAGGVDDPLVIDDRSNEMVWGPRTPTAPAVVPICVLVSDGLPIPPCVEVGDDA
jgi:hypothetical protein